MTTTDTSPLLGAFQAWEQAKGEMGKSDDYIFSKAEYATIQTKALGKAEALFEGIQKYTYTDSNGTEQTIGNPLVAFACLATYFAGKQEYHMGQKLVEYEKQHEVYKECLEFSKQAHRGKGECHSQKYSYSNTSEYQYNGVWFDSYMNRITDNKYQPAKGKGMDKGKDSKHSKDEWQSFIDVINTQKDIESTKLNQLSNEMDQAVKDSSSAEQMAANAVKKATDLMSTQAKLGGG